MPPSAFLIPHKFAFQKYSWFFATFSVKQINRKKKVTVKLHGNKLEKFCDDLKLKASHGEQLMAERSFLTPLTPSHVCNTFELKKIDKKDYLKINDDTEYQRRILV